MRVWITEKPDQAHHLAPLLGNAQKQRGYYDTDDGRVVWQYGHMLRQAAPEDYGPAWSWAEWGQSVQPMIPQTWRMLPDPDNRDQIAIVGQALKGASEVVIATDCDAEGEAIAREILEHFAYRGPIKRLWYNATDERSMRKALASLRDGKETLPMYWSSQARSRADWLIGMNLTRAYTLLSRARGGQGVRSIGRVQTPTLSLVVQRDRAIEQFIARSYYELEAAVTLANGQAVTLRHAPDEENRIFDRDQAQQLAQKAQGARGPITVEQEEKTTAPPKLFSMARLQKAASTQWGWGADKTLEVAQTLYDQPKGLLTYPRAGSVFLPEEQAPEIPDVIAALGTIGLLAPHVAAITVNGPIVRPTVFNTKKLAGEPHHAIIPTTVKADPATLSADERALYLLVAQQYLAALSPDYRYAETRLGLDANGVPFAAVGRVPLAQGWRAVFGGADPENDDDEPDAAPSLPAIVPNAPGTVSAVSIAAKKTRPPKRYTEGDLIADMAAIAKYATNPAIKARLRETSGIGTEATRASIIKNLRERGYLEKQDKFIISTAIGREHYDGIDPGLADPAMTGVWEDVLHAMRGGQLPESARDDFVGKVAGNVTRLIDMLRPHIAHAAANRAPSAQQLAYAQKLASELGVPLPPDAARSFTACTAFIDAHRERVAALPPTPAAVGFAEKIATAAGVPLPADVRTSREACSAFIEQHKKALPAPAKGKKRKSGKK
jgi:DNA topoisomerase-3